MMQEQHENGQGLAWVASLSMGELAERMRIRIIEFSLERAVATMPVEGNTQPAGLVHGGAYVVLGETLGSMAANYAAGPDRMALGVDVNATHTATATEGIVTAVCTPIHQGRNLAVHEIVITNERGQRCSTVRITNLIREARQN